MKYIGHHKVDACCAAEPVRIMSTVFNQGVKQSVCDVLVTMQSSLHAS